MKLEQQVVSLELAQKLKELGVKQESIFSFMLPLATGFSAGERITDSYILGEIKEWGIIHLEDYISAYTVAELGDMLPMYFSSEKHTNDWRCGFANSERFKDVWPTSADTEADCRAKMLIYLVENGLLKN